MSHINLHSFRRSEGGFSLIELLVAITLLVIALIPLAAILITGLQTSVNVSVRASARQLAESKMSQVRDMSFGAIGLAGATQTFASAANGEQVKPDSGSGLQSSSTESGPTNIHFTISRDVRKVIKLLAGSPATKQITVTVSWEASNPNGGGPIRAGSELLTTEIGQTDTLPWAP